MWPFHCRRQGTVRRFKNSWISTWHKRPSVCEPLESRRLLAIVWTNRGADNFTAAFPGNEAAARAVVDQAIADWNKIILDFNHAGGGNTFNITFTVANLGNNLRAQGGYTSEDGERVPNAGAVTLDDNAGGSGWYVDPSPGDEAEFTNFNTPFSAFGSFSGNDLFRTATHEIGHCVGIAGPSSGILIDDFLTDLGVDDPNDSVPLGGNLWSFNIGGGLYEATFTASAGGGHIWEGPAIPGRPDIPFHPVSLMNDGRASANNERKLIGDIEVQILNWVYGYTVAMPSTVNNMMVQPDYATDVLTVNGFPGNVNDIFKVQGTANPTELHVTVGSFTEIVPLGEVGTIVVNGGTGDDLFQLEYNANRFTTYNGGSGIDTLDLAFSTRNLSNIAGPTLFNGGSEFDRIFAYDNNYTAADLWSVDNDSFTRFATGTHQYDAGVEDIFLTTGTAHNPISITSTRAGSKFYLNTSGGQDLVNIGLTAAGTANIRGDIEIQNDPSFTTINIDDTGRTVSRFGLIELFGQFGWISGLAGADFTVGATIFWDNADVQEVRITTGGGNDGVEVRACSERLFIDNSGGRDNVTIGNGGNGLQQITQQIDIEPTPAGVFSTLALNDAASTIPRSPTWSASGADMLISNFAPVQIRYDAAAVDTFTMLGGLGNDTFVIAAGTYNDATTIDAGGGTDQVVVNGARMASLTVRGGTDALLDFLDIDDRTLPGNVVGGQVYPNRIDREMFPIQTSQVFYSGFSSVNWYQQPNQNAIQVFGTSSDIAPNFLFSIVGNSLDDYVEVYVRDTLGNQTINGNLYFAGGGGPDLLNVISASAAENFRFLNQFGGSTTYIGGAGIGWIAAVPGVENVIVNGSTANDTFAVDQFTSGCALRINGGPGNDNCTLSTGDMSATLTSAAGFTFDGQADSDRFTISNGATNTPWNYTTGNGYVQAQRPSTGYFWHSVTTNIESQYFFAGSAGDAFYLDVVSPGVYTECNGFGGIDGLVLGNATNNLETIRGPVVYNGGSDGGNMGAYDMADTTADVVHLTATTLGASPEDTLFGPGGSLAFSNLVNFGPFPGITLGLGSGGDSVYAQPLSSARVTINANNPTVPPGDSLTLALAGVTSPVITGGSTGNVTSANRQTLDWTGFEQPVATDSVAPQAAGIAFNPSVAGQSISFSFNENVAPSLALTSLSLFDYTSGSYVNSANISYQYAANTATWTFPGFGGVLPSGSYSAVLSGAADQAGNAATGQNSWNFIWSDGASSADTFKVSLDPANSTTFEVFKNNLVTPAYTASAGTLNQLAIQGRAGDDDFIIDNARGGRPNIPTAGAFNVFDGGNNADSVTILAATAPESFAFNAGSIVNNGNAISYAAIESVEFDDAGGGVDTLSVNGGPRVTFPDTQQLASLTIAAGASAAMAPNGNAALVVDSIAIDAGGALDVADNDVIIDYTGVSPIAAAEADVRSGYNVTGDWLGDGITSSLAAADNNFTVAIADNALLASPFGTAQGGPLFAGQDVDLTTILVKFTHRADVDLDGAITPNDSAIFGGNYSENGPAVWSTGDMDYDGVFTPTDAAIFGGFYDEALPLL